LYRGDSLPKIEIRPPGFSLGTTIRPPPIKNTLDKNLQSHDDDDDNCVMMDTINANVLVQYIYIYICIDALQWVSMGRMRDKITK
jgi:hypothetical protein